MRSILFWLGILKIPLGRTWSQSTATFKVLKYQSYSIFPEISFLKLFLVGNTYHFQALEALQAGMFLMVVDKVIVAELKTMHNTTTYEEKRLCCIGFSNLLAETVDKLG